MTPGDPPRDPSQPVASALGRLDEAAVTSRISRAPAVVGYGDDSDVVSAHRRRPFATAVRWNC